MGRKRKSIVSQKTSNTRLSEIDPSTVESGRRIVENLLQEIGDTPLSQLKGIESVDIVSATWEERPKSNIVKWLMDKSGKSIEDIAESLGCSTTYMNNKLYRDSFSFDDMIIVAYVCGYAMTFTANNPDDKMRDTYQINVEKYFNSYDEDALKRLRAYEQKLRMQKKDEYEELKAKLEQLKVEYGFED